MTTRVTLTGQDNWVGKRPMTDADRRRWFGPIQPMQQPTMWRRIFGGRDGR